MSRLPSGIDHWVTDMAYADEALPAHRFEPTSLVGHAAHR